MPVRPGTPDAPPAKGQFCNWDYTMSSSANSVRLAPLAVFDDGRDTYLMLPPDASWPTIDAEGVPETLRPAPGMAPNQLWMVPGVRTSFTLRAGNAAVTLWDDGAAARANGACPLW